MTRSLSLIGLTLRQDIGNKDDLDNLSLIGNTEGKTGREDIGKKDYLENFHS